MSLVDDGHTAWIVSELLINFIVYDSPKAYAKLDNRDCEAQRHPLTPSLFDTFSKNLSHTWC